MTGIDPNTTPYSQAYLVETLRHGQARPYAPSVYEYKLTITGKNIRTRTGGDLEPLICGRNPSVETVKKIVQAVCHNFYESEKMPNPFAPELLILKKVEDEPTHTTWHILIREEFCD